MTSFMIGLVFGALALLVIVFFVLAPPSPRVAVARRLEPGTVYVSALTRATDATVSAIDSSMRGRRRLIDEEELDLAGVKMAPSQVLLMTFIAGAVLAVLGAFAGSGTFWSVVFAVVFAAVAPIATKVILSLRTSRRRAKFATQLDDALQLVAGNLRAGYGLVQALDGVAQDLDEPISEEMARVVNETRLGRDLGSALETTAHRMQSDDFRWAAQAIIINRETGGNLAEVLENVAGTIRERNEIRGQVKALSAEGRLSATILSALPVVVFLAVLLLQPSYFTIFFTSIVGVFALFVSLMLLAVGIFWMFRVTRVKF